MRKIRSATYRLVRVQLAMVLMCFSVSCATTESYYRLPQSYHEQLEANDNPQNNGYVLRHRTNDPVGDVMGVLYIFAVLSDVFGHSHSRHCYH